MKTAIAFLTGVVAGVTLAILGTALFILSDAEDMNRYPYPIDPERLW